MPLLPYDYLHLVNCPEVVIISDILCNMECGATGHHSPFLSLPLSPSSPAAKRAANAGSEERACQPRPRAASFPRGLRHHPPSPKNPFTLLLDGDNDDAAAKSVFLRMTRSACGIIQNSKSGQGCPQGDKRRTRVGDE